ncbi:MAG: LysM peptidoglycan-binding domain-containing protein [Saprospiraceae bacterium]|nr:LysM peptidoglycan-binding domain-containing protein [Saprospiraceae bacterium]MCF8249484.1 LysM peptidoglycan-binding domain-containing protein [Saprospiraceae bacterium]MCF8280108.1 LysM peptidoglycan-binding domain-containing protein [Bacteroidales bacterium]MCF8310702.1 LysM peptidoglycan-binding domain-containing protein [Saprospiraceae bacterium]MCF8439467.1 LysM peptidoglycan-binding domain-containing protein [Saprospiraceae bacterium]
MYKKSLVLTLMSLLSATIFAQNSDFQAYIESYKKIAVREMDRAGIPASIKLAQALLESNAGKSELARKANNHFGIKCHSDWTGKTYDLEDDDYNEFGDLKKSCFRKYKDVEDSYIAHSEFLRDPRKSNRYGFLFRLETTDYKRWAKDLKSSGYATAGNYDNLLIKIIETYKLYEFDRFSNSDFPDGRPSRDKDFIAGLDLRRVNDVKVIFAKNNVTVTDISEKAKVSIKRLERYNEILPVVTSPLPDDTRIYIQPKHCRVRGGSKWHYVKKGEKLFDISQFYGIKMKRLRKRNRIPDDVEVQATQRLKLRGFKIRKGDRPRLETEPKPTETVPPLFPDDGFMQDDEVAPFPDTPSTPTTTDNPNPQPTQPTGTVYYTVVKGDTLYNISRRYGMTVDALMQLNNLSGNNLSIGQTLRVK